MPKPRSVKSRSATKPAIHELTQDTVWYTHPAQARSPDGTLPQGTRVVILQEAGSYTLVRTEDSSVMGYVSSDALPEAGGKNAAGTQKKGAGARKKAAGARKKAAGARRKTAGSRKQAAGARKKAAAGSRKKAAGARKKAAGGGRKSSAGRGRSSRGKR